MARFELDAHLAADTATIGDWTLSRVLLMNDSRFPWLVLVPRRKGCTEVFDLSTDDQNMLMAEIARAALAIRAVFNVEKINVGALGNIVPQLHVHVVGRRKGDAAWPGPVWGSGKAEAYSAASRRSWVERLSAELATVPAD
jgi:diadenosine tetraphosphate (Ap4A) HIT family hydrolase